MCCMYHAFGVRLDEEEEDDDDAAEVEGSLRGVLADEDDEGRSAVDVELEVDDADASAPVAACFWASSLARRSACLR